MSNNINECSPKFGGKQLSQDCQPQSKEEKLDSKIYDEEQKKQKIKIDEENIMNHENTPQQTKVKRNNTISITQRRQKLIRSQSQYDYNNQNQLLNQVNDSKLSENIKNLKIQTDKLDKIINNLQKANQQEVVIELVQLKQELKFLGIKITNEQIQNQKIDENIGLKDTIKILKVEIQNLGKRLKSQDIFISMIIHDMRNPINAVISMVESIQQELDQEYLRTQKLRKIFSGKELEVVKMIKQFMELSNLNQQSLTQQLQAINHLLNNKDPKLNGPQQNQFKQQISQQFNRSVYDEDDNAREPLFGGSNLNKDVERAEIQQKGSPRRSFGQGQSVKHENQLKNKQEQEDKPQSKNKQLSNQLEINQNKELFCFEDQPKDDECNLEDEVLDELIEISKPIDKMQRDFLTNANELKKLNGQGGISNKLVIDNLENQMQKYILDNGLVVNNPAYKSLYELANVSNQKIVILEKQYIFTTSQAIIPNNDIYFNIDKQEQEINLRKQQFYKNYENQQNKESQNQQNNQQNNQINQAIPVNQQRQGVDIQVVQSQINSSKHSFKDYQFNRYSQNLSQMSNNQDNVNSQNLNRQPIDLSQKSLNKVSNRSFNDQQRINDRNSDQQRINDRGPDQQQNLNHLTFQQPSNNNYQSLKSISEQAQLLLQLQINQNVQRESALKELKKIQDAIEEDLLSRQKMQYMNNLIQGLNFQAKMLLNLVNDLLDYAKFENGNFIFLNDIFNLADLIKKNSFSTLHFQAEERKIKLKYQVSLELNKASQTKNYDFSVLLKTSGDNKMKSGEIKFKEDQIEIRKMEKIEKLFLRRVLGDERRYLQILLNFLSNALKFSQKNGTISVNIRITSLQFEEETTQKSQKSNNKMEEDDDQSEESEKDVMRKMPNLLNQIVVLDKANDKEINSQNLKIRSGEITNKSIFNFKQKRNLKYNSSELFLKDQSKSSIIKNEEFFTKQKQNPYTRKNSVKENKSFINIEFDKKQKEQDDDQQFFTGHIQFIIEIVDNGIGIKKENINKLFLEFTKLDEQSKLNRQGTGLGLTISRKMVRQMGGDITVQSEFGKGTTFSICVGSKVKIAKIDLKKFEVKQEGLIIPKYSKTCKDFPRIIISSDQLNSQNSQQKERLQLSLLKSQENDDNNLTNNKKLGLKSPEKKVKQKISVQQLSKMIGNLQHDINSSRKDSITESLLLQKQISQKRFSISSSMQINQIEQVEIEDDNIDPEKIRIKQQNEALQQLLKESILNNQKNLNQMTQQPNNPVFNRPRSNSLQSKINPLFQNKNQEPAVHNQEKHSSARHLLDIQSKIIPKNLDYNPGSLLDQALQKSGLNPMIQPNKQKLFSIKSESEKGSVSDSQDDQNQVKKQAIQVKNIPAPESNQQFKFGIKDYQQQIANIQKNKFEYQASKKLNISQNSVGNSQIDFSKNQKIDDINFQSAIRKIKCLVANDESFQLQYKTAILKRMNFKVQKAENGQVAFNKVRYFIENYNKVRERLQHPDANYKSLSVEDKKMIQTTLKNYDFIILDLNMPILNGYQACQRINEVYNSFNSLPDYDDILSNSSKEQKHLIAINKIFQENDIQFQDDSDEISQSYSIIRRRESKVDPSLEAQNSIIQNVKEFYEFRRLFNGMLRARPLMVACSADYSPDVISQAKAAGFDIVIQSPLTEQKIKDTIMIELDKKHQTQARMLQQNFNVTDFQNQVIDKRIIQSIKKLIE